MTTRTSRWLSPSGLFASAAISTSTRTFRQRGRLRCRPVLIELEDRRLFSLTTLATFNFSNGASPVGGVIMDSSGNLYGTTTSSEPEFPPGGGTVFELPQGSGTVITLDSLGENPLHPDGDLIMDSSGNLYGTTFGGGNGTTGGVLGTVFELPLGSGTIDALASFGATQTDGARPWGGVIMDSSGNLYGTTEAAGPYGYGTVFELPKGGGTVTTLASFNGTNGANPYSGVIMDSSGNLYGTTEQGGACEDGTVFELPKGSGTVTALASFNGTNGQDPYDGVIMDSSGNLYGTTYFGGTSDDGTVFELPQGSATITALASFDGTHGANPFAGVIMDSSGNLYGTTYFGGTSDDGTVFELPRGSATITALASFNGTNGADPYAGVVMDSSGNLYGTTESGGASNDGTVFEVTAQPLLTSSAATSEANSTVSFTVTVAGNATNTPTGRVTFQDNGNPIATVTLRPTGVDMTSVARLTVVLPNTGTDTVTAVYNGDCNFPGGTSNSLTQTVTAAAPTGCWTSLNNPANGPGERQYLRLDATVRWNGHGPRRREQQ